MAPTQFTEEQLEVISHRGQHALVSAVAGSGKTTVLVARNEALIREGHDPRTLLNLVFNKSAAESFQRRIKERMGEQASTVRTFHSMSLNMLNRLRIEGLVQPFEVDAEGTKLGPLAKQCLKSAWNPKQLSEMYSCADDFPVFMGRVKAGLRSPDAVWASLGYSAITRPFIKAFEIYEAQRAKRRIVGFDDMLYDTAKVLGEHEDAWGLFNQFATEVMADEAQDLNDVQLYLLQGIVGSNAHLMAVGDEDQAIYVWRGAKVENLLVTMPDMFSPMRRMTLSWNFRYGHKTALAANAVIRNNTQRTPKMTVSAAGNPQTELTVLPQRDLTPLIERLKPLQAEGRLDEVCLLVREFDHAVRFELALADAKIPYFVLGRQSLGAVQEVAAFVALLSLWVGHWELPGELMQEQCVEALLRTPTTFLTNEQHGVWLSHVRGSQDADQFLAGTDEAIQQLDRTPANAEAVKRMVLRKEALETVWRMPSSSKPSLGIGIYVGVTNLDDVVKRTAATEERAAAILGNVRAVREAAERSHSINKMLESFATAMTVSSNLRSSSQRVLVTSCHRAKGLEWTLVVLGSLGPAILGPEGEEERRLAYVAITRAQQELIVLSDQRVHTQGPCDPRLRGGTFLNEAMLPDADAVGQALYEGSATTIEVGDEALYSAYLGRLTGCPVRARSAKPQERSWSLGDDEKRLPTHGVPEGREALAKAQGGRLCSCGRFNRNETLSKVDPRCMCGKSL